MARARSRQAPTFCSPPRPRASCWRKVSTAERAPRSAGVLEEGKACCAAEARSSSPRAGAAAGAHLTWRPVPPPLPTRPRPMQPSRPGRSRTGAPPTSAWRARRWSPVRHARGMVPGRNRCQEPVHTLARCLACCLACSSCRRRLLRFRSGPPHSPLLRLAHPAPFPHPLHAASFFDVFLGPQPLDERGRLDVGYGLTWAANGYRCAAGRARARNGPPACTALGWCCACLSPHP